MEELLLAWRETDLLNQALAQQEQLRQREAGVDQKELEIERQKTALAERQIQVEKERAEFYKLAMEELTKGRSFGCTLAKIFTLGLARCL